MYFFGVVYYYHSFFSKGIYKGMSTEEVRPLVSVRRLKQPCKCQREIGLDPGGKAIRCRFDTTIEVAGVALCQIHAKERMQIAELTGK